MRKKLDICCYKAAPFNKEKTNGSFNARSTNKFGTKVEGDDGSLPPIWRLGAKPLVRGAKFPEVDTIRDGWFNVRTKLT